MHLDRSTIMIFRDCLKLIPRMGVDAKNVANVRALLKAQFVKNRFETDQKKIENMRESAIRGISNYILLTIKQEYLKNPKQQTLSLEDSDEEEREEAPRQQI